VMEMFTQHLPSHSVTMNFPHTPFFPPPATPHPPPPPPHFPCTVSPLCRRVSE
jgi:hypothetical protein